jgi:hypothetical protein
MLVAMAAAAAVGYTLAPARGLAVPYAAVGCVGVETLYIIVFISKIAHAGHAAWREELREKLKLPDLPELAFAIYFRETPRIWNLRIPFDAVFLVETDAGFVILGESTRVLIPIESITRVEAKRIFFNPPRTALQVDTAGRRRHLAFIEKKTFRENRALARACAERVRARLGGR